MKQTFFLFSAIIVLIASVAFTTQSDKGTLNTTCCQTFEIVSSGVVLTGCVITVNNPACPSPAACQCNVDPTTSQCTICDLPAGTVLTADVVCDGKHHGSAKFTACDGPRVVRIIVQ